MGLKINDLKEAVKQVQAVKKCPVCQSHIEAIKDHQNKGHPQQIEVPKDGFLG